MKDEIKRLEATIVELVKKTKTNLDNLEKEFTASLEKVLKENEENNTSLKVLQETVSKEAEPNIEPREKVIKIENESAKMGKEIKSLTETVKQAIKEVSGKKEKSSQVEVEKREVEVISQPLKVKCDKWSYTMRLQLRIRDKKLSLEKN